MKVSNRISDDWVRSMACAVIMQAIKDAQGMDMGNGSVRHSISLIRKDTKRFLHGGADLRIWCAVAELDYKSVLMHCIKYCY
jgi:hypothetical protein